jgi:hypothetical protein
MEGYLIIAGTVTLILLGFVINVFLHPERRGTVWREVVKQRASIILTLCVCLLLGGYYLLALLLRYGGQHEWW